jgi:hypothetical protein
MKRQYFGVIVVICLVFTMLFGSSVVSAEGELKADISSFTVKNIDGSDVTEGNLMAGNTYMISFEIDIGVTLGNKTIILSTPLEKVEDVYWHLENDYEGVDTDTWQPGQSKIEFNIVKGNATFTLIGRVPSDYASEKLSNDRYIHFPRMISLVQPSIGPENTPLVDQAKKSELEVVDQAIVTYRQAFIEKESLLKTTEADQKYEDLATSIIDEAEELRKHGYVDEATIILNTIPESSADFPVPVEEGSYTLYIVIIALLALVLISLIALILRARSNNSFILQQIDEEAGRLDVLLVRISKIDKQLARDIEQVKEQLERISGR